MREYRRIRTAITLFVTACFLGGLLSLLRPDREVFPFYSWFLFALVPNGSPQYALLLHETNGRIVEPPKLFQEADGLVSAPHSVTAFKLIQEFGTACEQNQRAGGSARILLEKNCLPPQTKYEVVKISADPIMRWKTGYYQITAHMGLFETAVNSP